MNEIDEYISAYPKEIQEILKRIRATVKTAAPDAKEIMSYGMPALRQKRNLIYYAGFKKHIGLFPPVPEALLKEAKKYAGPKWNLKFPYDQPIPYDLIRKIVEENLKNIQSH